jgi:VWFA-related protein
MTRSLPIVLALLATGSLLDAQRFTSTAEAVRVDVLVTDGRKAVRGLTAPDFEVLDVGVPQRVQLVEVEQLPLNLICVFDTSGSVAGARLGNLMTAGHALLEGLQPRDRVALLSFASRVRLHAGLTDDRRQIVAGIDALAANGTTSLRDAAFAGLALREADPGRTVLLLFSDGADTSSWLPAPRVLDAAKRTDVVVYSVALRGQGVIRVIQPLTSGQMLGAGPASSALPRNTTTSVTTIDTSKFLEDLSDETGGRVVRVDADRDLRATFVSTLAEFRDRYVLTYAPTGVPAGGWHPLTVRLKSKAGKVTARRGYFAQ